MRHLLHATCPHYDLMYTWTFLLIYLTVEYGQASSEAHYECGPHGRFEYCVDGFAGCVIGCHCHPGYYFDTESKICEPNVKLTNDYRRHFYLQPTRSPPSSLEPLTSPTPTTTNLIEEKVDAIAKDADDLGDWLYNQFFKTIENQVINNTDGQALTRRSGNDAVGPTPKRRSRKKGKKKSKKKKFTKKGLRRKLLRITEDDSLFDSSSDSSSDESSGSSDSDSDTSEESDKDHDHRKIIMINKKPPSPLPSFIFLPNVETPFYPPIGLPPPPIVPMYPMVPVPPVGSFYAGHCENDTTTTVTPAPTTKETVVTTVSMETEATTTTTEPDLSPTEETTITDLRTNKREQQNKLMHKLRNKLKKRNKNMNQFQLQAQQETLPNDIDPINSMQFRSQPMYDGDPPMDDVDFQYLSQLIHKIDLNKTQPDIMFNPSPTTYEIPNINPGVPMRRNYGAPNSQAEYFHTRPKINRPASKADETNDSYYSNLGKQIASLIRKVDSGGERQINIELEQGNVKSPMQTVFHENSYSPRSYWERFVRSPLKQKQMYNGDIGVHSTEDLFDLENKVNVATTIERILSLQELENIANIMEMAKSESINRPPRPMRPAADPTARRSNRFNVNLLEPYSGRTTSTSSLGKNSMMKEKEVSSEQNLLTPYHYSHLKYNPQNSMAFTHHTNKIQENDMRNLKNIKQKELHKELKSQISQHQGSGLAQKNFTNPKMPIAQQVFKYQQNPMMLNYRSMNYVGNNHKQYNPQNSILPLPIYSPHSAKSLPSNDRPSYFHHEYNRFDFFN